MNGAVYKPAYRKRRRVIEPFGLLVHTSGMGIVERARRLDVEPIGLALEWYRKKGSVHYVIDVNGTIYQMLDDDRRGAHVGISILERWSYLSGRWVHKMRKKYPNALRLWQSRWPGYQSPQHLYPGKSPNGCYIGVEMIPQRPLIPGLWFSAAQHEAVSRLYKHLALTHCWPDGDPRRLVGHEDIDAFARWDSSGGWDPGAVRSKPRFDWSKVKV